jgi:hypothetical protein
MSDTESAIAAQAVASKPAPTPAQAKSSPAPAAAKTTPTTAAQTQAYLHLLCQNIYESSLWLACSFTWFANFMVFYEHA